MRLTVPVLLLLCLAACGGPRVGSVLVRQLPPGAAPEAMTLAAQAETLQTDEESRARTLASARSDADVLALEIRAMKATIKADKAALKTARKSGNRDREDTMQLRMRASEAELTRQEREYDIQRERVALLAAQLDLVRAQRQVREAERQVVLARAVNELIEPVDVARMRSGVAEAKSATQRAREQVARAEERYARAGGEPLDPVPPLPLPPGGALDPVETSDETSGGVPVLAPRRDPVPVESASDARTRPSETMTAMERAAQASYDARTGSQSAEETTVSTQPAVPVRTLAEPVSLRPYWADREPTAAEWRAFLRMLKQAERDASEN